MSQTNVLSLAMTRAPAAVLECENIAAFYGRIQVVFDASLDVRGGESVAVLGSNGAGKTSLLGAIAGSVQATGRVSVLQQPLQGLPAHKRARCGLAYVPEGRKNLFPAMTVAENLDIGLQLSRPSERNEILDFVLRLFPILKDRKTTAAGMLSGGEQQMLAIAVALGRRPTALLLDEPSQGLAPAVFDILQQAFEELRKKNIALLIAEQNLLFAAQVCDRYIIISQGEVVAAGGRDDLNDNERIMAAYLGRR